ncbi:MAG TPA: serine/threonine-protein kinase [Kofleriaceae bacterium]|nr:serine/threonine-protein kinase [Kofleriaceae bacterium]
MSRADSERVDKLIGEVLANRYRVENRLGEGAMGSVYKAKHVKVGRAFAVKVLHPRLLEDDKVVQRFEREAELAGRLRHPNVIGVVDVGETTDGLRYMVMDFAEGPDMSSLLAEAPMPPQRIIHLVRQLLEGLFHAHCEGLIHRDFKPENVIVEKDSHGNEVPRIVDFGIAILREGGDSSAGPGRLTTNGLVLGTPHYMAPEQAVNDPIDHRIDLFALGIMIYEMLSGKLPFDGNGAEVARANLMLDPPPISVRVPYLEVDPLLEAYARRLMAKSRDARPPTAKVARELLDLIEKDRGAAAAALGVPLAATRTSRTTEPVAPRNLDEHYEGTFPPPIREQLATPPQAPPMSDAVARSEGVRERSIETDVAEPLTLPRKRRGLLIGAAAGGIGLVVVLGLVLASHEPRPPTIPDVPTAVVEQPVPMHIAEQPPVVTPPVVTPTPPSPPVVVTTTTAKPATKPKPQPHLAVAVAKPTQVDTHPGVVGVAAASQATPNASYDATAFVTQLKLVGAEVHAFAESHPENVSDLQARLTRINVNSALADPTARNAARGQLDQIHSEIMRRSK